MSSPREVDGSRFPRAGPGVVLVCESCDHVWEPSLADLDTRPVTCTRCGGWTMIAELAEPTTTTATPQHPATTQPGPMPTPRYASSGVACTDA
ncbi:MAG: hypothetical protein ACRDS1_14620 [Pseudonocardiaceae bacterium]